MRVKMTMEMVMIMISMMEAVVMMKEMMNLIIGKPVFLTSVQITVVLKF